MNEKRLIIEERAMRDLHGDGPKVHFDPERRILWWNAVIKVHGNEFPVAIEYPESYPADPPDIRLLCELPKCPPHMWSGNKICWIVSSPSARHRGGWNPGRDTAARGLTEAKLWFLCYLVWDVLGDWPVPDAHDTE